MPNLSKRSRTCFKAYDIRGRVPDELDTDLAYRIGVAYAQYLRPQRVVIGYDVRLTSPMLAQAVTHGLLDSGVDVTDIGLCGTEEVYFAVCDGNYEGGIMITASHNPSDYNGMKLVRDQAKPISIDTGLQQIHDQLPEALPIHRLPSNPPPAGGGWRGAYAQQFNKRRYIDQLVNMIPQDALQPLTIVVNAGHGSAGLVIDALEAHLPFRFIKLHHPPDGRFPQGVPNPLLPECRHATAQAVTAHRADFGVAWDGDFDRCFFFDAQGQFIEGYYLVGLFAEALLATQPGSIVIHDPRLIWNTQEQVQQAGGIALQSKAGHAFIKERMRAENALYGGEMSGHYYFRSFAYCDSGMIPFLMLAARLSQGISLSELVADRMRRFPCSGELNFSVSNATDCIKRITDFYAPQNPQCDTTDGVSLEFPEWRFNVRSSNTEPLLRLNIETRGDPVLLQQSIQQLSARIRAASIP